MPVFNAEQTVGAAIKSILCQTYQNFELIVINDGSSDRSEHEIEKFKNDPRVKIISQKNMGLVNALNTGLEACSGQFIARMDSDDISLPDRFELQIRFFLENPEIDVLSGAYIPFKNATPSQRASQPVIHPTDPSVIHWMLKYYCVIAHPAVMFRKAISSAGHKYNNVPAEDLDLWRKVSNGRNISNLDDVILFYRISPDSLSKKNFQHIREYINENVHEASKPTLSLLVKSLLKIRGINHLGILWRWIND